MRILKRAAAATVVFAVMMALSAASVGAVRSWQGSNYSYDYAGGYNIMTCDMEDDGQAVKSRTDNNQSGNGHAAAEDIDGANGICGSRHAGYRILRHRTCKTRSWWRSDVCDNWQTTWNPATWPAPV